MFVIYKLFWKISVRAPIAHFTIEKGPVNWNEQFSIKCSEYCVLKSDCLYTEKKCGEYGNIWSKKNLGYSY